MSEDKIVVVQLVMMDSMCLYENIGWREPEINRKTVPIILSERFKLLIVENR